MPFLNMQKCLVRRFYADLQVAVIHKVNFQLIQKFYSVIYSGKLIINLNKKF